MANLSACEAMSTCDHLAKLKELLADPKLRIEASCLQRIQPIGEIHVFFPARAPISH